MKPLVIANLVVGVASLAILTAFAYKGVKAQESFDQVASNPIGALMNLFKPKPKPAP